MTKILYEYETDLPELYNLLLNLDSHPLMMIFKSGRGRTIILYSIEIHSSRRFGFDYRTRSINSSNGGTEIDRR